MWKNKNSQKLWQKTCVCVGPHCSKRRKQTLMPFPKSNINSAKFLDCADNKDSSVFIICPSLAGQPGRKAADDYNRSSSYLAQCPGIPQSSSGMPGQMPTYHLTQTFTPSLTHTHKYSLCMHSTPPCLCLGVRGVRPDRVHSWLHLHHTWRLDPRWASAPFMQQA